MLMIDKRTSSGPLVIHDHKVNAGGHELLCHEMEQVFQASRDGSRVRESEAFLSLAPIKLLSIQRGFGCDIAHLRFGETEFRFVRTRPGGGWFDLGGGAMNSDAVCAHCGAEPVFRAYRTDRRVWYQLACSRCGLATDNASTASEALQLWVRLVQPPDIRGPHQLSIVSTMPGPGRDG